MNNKILSQILTFNNLKFHQIQCGSIFQGLNRNNFSNLSNEVTVRHYSHLPLWNAKFIKKLSNVSAKQLGSSTTLFNDIGQSSYSGIRYIQHRSNDLSEAQGFKTSTPTESQLSVCQVLELCKDRLKKEEIDEAKLHSEYIVAHALNIRRITLKTIMDEPISTEEIDYIEKMMDCRLARMPLQYIFGNWDFHSITLKLRPPVFIPRQETEGLVNISVQLLRDVEEPMVLDVGCGSGAISLALLNHFPKLNCVALDQSKYAAELTLENAIELNLSERLRVVQGKVSDESFPSLPSSQFDLIVSNPPYVLRKDLIDLQQEIILYEDLRALDGGKDGLDVIQRIILHGQHLLKEGGCMLMEVDPCHRYLLPCWMEKNKTSLKICQFYKDNYGVQRYVKLVKS